MQPHTAPDEGSEWILIIDDEPTKRYLVRRLLERQGYACVEAVTGTEGLQQARQQPSVIVLDVALPDISGIEVCQILKRQPETAAIPVALLSAVLTDAGHRVRGLEAGADAYLTGAIDEVFVAHIQALIRLARAERAAARNLAREQQARQQLERASADLQRERDLLQKVLQSLTEGVVVQGPAGQVLLTNDRALQMLGLSTDQMATRTSLDYRWQGQREDGSVLPGEEHPPMVALRTRKPQENKVMGVRRPDDALIWLSVSSQPMLSPETGEPTGVVSSFTDVTDRKRVDEERQQLISVLENSEDIVAIASLDGRLLYLNPAGRRAVGLSSLEEAQSYGVLDFFPPEDQQTIRDQVWPSVHAGLTWRGEQKLRHFGTGELIPVERNVYLIRDPSGERPIGLATISRDITQRRRAEERNRALVGATELLQSSLDVSSTLRNLAEFSVPLLADWCVIDVLNREEKLERLVVKHADPSKEELARALQRREVVRGDGDLSFARVLSTGQPLLISDLDDTALTQTATDAASLNMLRDIHLQSVAILPMVARGRVLGVIGFSMAESGRHFDAADFEFLQELARRASLAVDNARLYQAAQTAIRARDDIFAVATHELRTPLTSIKIKLSLIERNANRKGSLTAGEVAEQLTLAKRQVDRLTTLMDGLLDLSKLQNDRFELNVEPVDLAELMLEVSRRLGDQARLAGCEVVVHPAEPTIVQGDRLRLDQVLTNLLTNAFKYGQGKPVEVRLSRDDEDARVSVRDHGIGIAPEHLERVFQRYERATDAHREVSVGLGLYIAQQIMRAHSGFISVESHPGEGSTFTLNVPLRGASSAHPRPE